MPSSKPLTIAFLFNLRHGKVDVNDPEYLRQLDFDNLSTVEAMTKHLQANGYNVVPIEANEKTYLTLYKKRKAIDLVFNYTTGFRGRNRTAQIPAMLEMLQIPYLGSSPFTQAITLNKAHAKDFLRLHNVPTLPYQLFKTGDEPLLPNLFFPLIIKPVAEGQSAGMTNENVVRDEPSLRRRLYYMIDTFRQGALVEPFLEGREFNISLVGNPPEIFPIVELDHSRLPKGYLPFASFEVKVIFKPSELPEYAVCPAKISSALREKLETVARNAWTTLELEDWCRIDIRCDTNENPYVLEINSPASLEPPETTEGYCSFPLAAKTAGISYTQLLGKMVDVALSRYGIKK